MSSNGVGSETSGRRRTQGSRWTIRLLIVLIALILSVIIILFFFSPSAISR